MNSLMTLAAAGALVIGERFEAATAMFLFSVSLGLEAFSLDRARHAIHALMELAPSEATRLSPAGQETIPVSAIAVGDRLLLRPGERVPVDGVVVEGRSSVNQAPVTGESVPVDLGPGDRVYSGSLNGEAALQIEATRPASESTLARIIHLIEEAQSRRAPSQRLVDRFAGYYTPAVLVLAVLAMVVPPTAGQLGAAWAAGASWSSSVYRGLVLLVIACPCALVISTPVTIVCGLFHAARRGVLIKGGVHLENAGRIRAVVFDKTGTLSRGALQVETVVPLDGRESGELLALAAAVEAHSEHPVARAICAAARKRQLDWPEVSGFEALRGAGARGTVNGETVYLGNRQLFEEWAGPFPRLDSAARTLEESPHTGVIVGTAEGVAGLIFLSDAARPEARETVARLRRLGVERLAMVTGDNERAARALAQNVDIDEVYAELLPEQKVEKVRELMSACGLAAMVGDGVNDAPALAASSLGIALGTAGSDSALETADVALMSDNLLLVPELILLGRRTRSIVWQNVVFALATKLAVVVLALAGLAGMWMAVAADAGASLVVIFNGMRLWFDGLRSPQAGPRGKSPEGHDRSPNW
jgi:Cd2+/Zn2+-exporting ATPase